MILPECSSPVLIVNPSLVELACQCDYYWIDGHMYNIFPDMKGKLLAGDSPFKILRIPYVKKFDFNRPWSEVKSHLDFLDNFWLGKFDGQIFPIFMYVSCGHCSTCVSKKIAGFSQRCKFAIEESCTKALFVRLSYNNKHLPSGVEYCGDECRLCANPIVIDNDIYFLPPRRDIQLFQKKLKSVVKSWYRCCGYDDQSSRDKAKKLKFIYSGELGGNFHRPHWHVIIFGLGDFLPNPHSDFLSESWSNYIRVKLIQYAWRDAVRLENGLFESFPQYLKKYPLAYEVPVGYDPYSLGYEHTAFVKSSKAVGYALKYAFKDTVDSKSIFGASINLGVDFVKSNFDYIESSLDNQFEYFSKVDGTLYKCGISKYYIDKLFPCYSKLVPIEFRRRFFRFMFFSDYLMSVKNLSKDVYCILMSNRLVLLNEYKWLSFDYSLEYPLKNVLSPVTADVDDNELSFFSFQKESKSPVLFSVQQCLQDFMWLLNHRVDYDEVEYWCNRRLKFLSKFPKRDYSSIVQRGKIFSEELSVMFSKSIF